jgi:hypothetical protein
MDIEKRPSAVSAKEKSICCLEDFDAGTLDQSIGNIRGDFLPNSTYSQLPGPFWENCATACVMVANVG